MKDVILLVDNIQVIVTDASSVIILICNIIMFLLTQNQTGIWLVAIFVVELIKINAWKWSWIIHVSVELTGNEWNMLCRRFPTMRYISPLINLRHLPIYIIYKNVILYY